MLPIPTILDSEILEARSTLATRIASSTIKDLRLQCTILGLVTGNRIQRLLIDMIKKFPNQPVVYEGFDHGDLVDFVTERRLQLSTSAQRHLTRCDFTRTLVAQAQAELGASQLKVHPKGQLRKQPNEAASGHRHPLSNSAVTAPRRSSRLAAQTPYALNKAPSVEPSGALVRPAKTSANRKVIHLSPWKALQKLQTSSCAAKRQSKKSLIQHLEAADRHMQFDFLGMPAELRDMVYHLVCISSTTIVQPRRQPAIATTCQLLRHEALAVYYGFNRFTVYAGNPVPPAHLKRNHWLHALQPCYLASVRSISFVYIGAISLLDIDFDIRGQKFSVVRRSRETSSEIAQELDVWLRDPSSYFFHTNYLVKPIEAVRSGSTLEAEYAYTNYSPSLLAAFNALVKKRVDIATTASAKAHNLRRWRVLNGELEARKGFSAASIMVVARMLGRRDQEVKDFWVGQFQH